MRIDCVNSVNTIYFISNRSINNFYFKLTQMYILNPGSYYEDILILIMNFE
jgi:hypothetical protein